MHSKYDNMHMNGIFNILIYINNHVNSCINYMLSGILINYSLVYSTHKTFLQSCKPMNMNMEKIECGG